MRLCGTYSYYKFLAGFAGLIYVYRFLRIVEERTVRLHRLRAQRETETEMATDAVTETARTGRRSPNIILDEHQISY